VAFRRFTLIIRDILLIFSQDTLPFRNISSFARRQRRRKVLRHGSVVSRPSKDTLMPRTHTIFDSRQPRDVAHIETDRRFTNKVSLRGGCPYGSVRTM